MATECANERRRETYGQKTHLKQPENERARQRKRDGNRETVARSQNKKDLESTPRVARGKTLGGLQPPPGHMQKIRGPPKQVEIHLVIKMCGLCFTGIKIRS